MQELRHQRGGTFLGLVLGVVIGLGVALGVALYVTKVPVTFVNKVLNRSAEQDAQEQQKNKDWDPNAPLYGKNPARPSNTVAPKSEPTAPSPANATAGDPANPAVSASGAPAVAASPSVPPASSADTATASPPAPTSASSPLPSPVASDPIAELARSKGLVAAPAAALDPFTYYIQVGAFRSDPDAKAFVEKLLQAGFVAQVSQREQAGRPVFRVRLGPFQTRDEANAQKQLLTAKSFETVMVRVQR